MNKSIFIVISTFISGVAFASSSPAFSHFNFRVGSHQTSSFDDVMVSYVGEYESDGSFKALGQLM